MKSIQNKRYLGWVIPFPRFQPILYSCYFSNVLNRKRLSLIKVVEQFQYFNHFFFSCDFLMVLYDLSKEHLPYSHHASPSCIRNKWASQLIFQLWKTRPISQPRSLSKYIIYLLVDLLNILLLGYIFDAQYKDFVVRAQDREFIIFLKVAESFVFDVVGKILDFFNKVELSLFFFLTWVKH